ncbi:putative bifunctional diguanylate cyclase/phosphodiesterase [Labrys monachus]|uniref:Diguanylate cyclase (GGDEF)-like protein n=1 Tax=Labrys monachus TaxID=217067 RepID=A0ABU0FFZ6_9HYPH|nr:bifunctional diguanylate cyclase/phosphodiesterase [Labrys monachus]MDQ0393537.1 diguanylate cyclase (GGDEF)-like protein [Labrys monachus]
MRQETSESMEIESVINASLRLQKAASEAEIFTVLYEACTAVAGPVGLDGWVIGHSRSAHHVAHLGPESVEATVDEVEAWLAGGSLPEAFARHDHVATDVTTSRLESEKRVVGGIVVIAARLTSLERRYLFDLARLAAEALAKLPEMRRCQLVLEALEQSEEAISFYDETEGIVFTNDAYHRIFQHYPDRSELLGMNHLDLYRLDLNAGVIEDPLAQCDPEAYLAQRARLSATLVGQQREIQTIRGRTYIYTRSRSTTGATMSRRIDITEQVATEMRLRERERELHDLAFRDSLTGLYNRAHLRDLLGSLTRQVADGTLAGVTAFLVDLDEFKWVNDTYGHDWGDHVLKTVADRLSRSSATDGGAVARIGGDEFVVLFEAPFTPEEMVAAGDRFIAVLAEPMAHDGMVLRIGASIGIAHRCGAAADIATILTDADFAMYEAKKVKGGASRVFTPGLKTATLDRLRLLEDIRNALYRREFTLLYQPQFSIGTRRLNGFEALARWMHPTRGSVPPDIFIPMLEEHGLIEEFGEWVLETACSEAMRWPDDLGVAINVSPLQVHAVRFSLKLCETLMRTGLRPGRLELEVTETVFLDGKQQTEAVLNNWKALGIRIALDDFGHGYSSLSYLGNFPIDKLKIDRGFLGQFDPSQPQAKAGVILDTIIDLGRKLGMTVTAEGVESAEQLEHLHRHGCTEAQGFLLGRPMSADEVRQIISARVTPPPSNRD